MARTKKGESSGIPETEMRLRTLQEEYMKEDCSEEVKDEYILLLKAYARSLTLKEIKKLRIYLPPERVDEISTDVVLVMLRQYKKKGWKVRASFGGTLYWKVREVMFKSKDEEMNLSLNTSMSDNADSKEVLDIINPGVVLPLLYDKDSEINLDAPEDSFIRSVNTAFEEVKVLIEEAYETLPYETFLKFVPWLLLQFRKSKTRNIQQLFKEMFLSSKEESAFDILLLETKNRIAKYS